MVSVTSAGGFSGAGGEGAVASCVAEFENAAATADRGSCRRATDADDDEDDEAAARRADARSGVDTDRNMRIVTLSVLCSQGGGGRR